MPELPEVETIRRQLKGRLEGHTIGDAWGFDSPKFATAAESAGARLGRLRRRGKYLLVDLFDQEAGQDPEAGQEPPRRELVIHLGMTGRLAVVRNGDRPQGCADRHLRARFELDDGSYLGMWDLRRFGRAVVVPTGEYRSLPTLAALGPEPFSAEFTPAALRIGLSGRKAIKTALMDQRVVAGVGNIYADEALWRSGIRPTARRLGPERAERLQLAVVEVLEQAVGNGGTTLRDYRDAAGEEGSNQRQLYCYGRRGLPCLRCGAELRHVVLDGRSTTFCARCQT